MPPASTRETSSAPETAPQRRQLNGLREPERREHG